MVSDILDGDGGGLRLLILNNLVTIGVTAGPPDGDVETTFETNHPVGRGRGRPKSEVRPKVNMNFGLPVDETGIPIMPVGQSRGRASSKSATISHVRAKYQELRGCAELNNQLHHEFPFPQSFLDIDGGAASGMDEHSPVYPGIFCRKALSTMVAGMYDVMVSAVGSPISTTVDRRVAGT